MEEKNSTDNSVLPYNAHSFYGCNANNLEDLKYRANVGSPSDAKNFCWIAIKLYALQKNQLNSTERKRRLDDIDKFISKAGSLLPNGFSLKIQKCRDELLKEKPPINASTNKQSLYSKKVNSYGSTNDKKNEPDKKSECIVQ